MTKRTPLNLKLPLCPWLESGPTVEETVKVIVAETIDDIVAKTGNAPDIDLAVLHDHVHGILLFCGQFWGAYEGARDHAPSRKDAIDARDAAGTLLTLLQNEALRREAEAVGLLPPLETSPLEAFYDRINPEKLAVGAKEVMERTKRDLGIWGRPLDRLIEWLMHFYEDIFKQDATSWRPREGGPPDTPFVRFVLRVTTALKIKCAPASIQSAYDRIQKRQGTHTTSEK
jgi:hypothetical protein